MTDSGIGIAADKITDLFEAFTQADASTTRQYGGTGLGLSISKQLCELMSGTVSVTSQLGRGSCFEFTVKLQACQSIIQTPSTRADYSAAPTNSALAHQSIAPKAHKLLLAEDNGINQQLVLGLLDNIGLSADIANNGLEAIKLIIDTPSTHRYDLIIMDCQMPEMDGYEATRQIRSGIFHAYQNIPILALTANNMQGDREKCLAAGMSDFLSKPIDPSEFQAKLLTWLPKIST